jgi:hypothetical protein
MGSQQPLLLFFDTFSHEIVEELNLDLVSGFFFFYGMLFSQNG